MSILRLISIFVVAGTATLIMPATAESHQVEQGDCPQGQAFAVSVACGTGPAAERAVARCGSGCCDQASLRQQALAGCADTSRAKNFNSSRSNRGSVMGPPDDEATQVDATRDRGEFESEAGAHQSGTMHREREGRNPQTGKEIKIPVDDDSDSDELEDAEEKTDDGDDGDGSDNGDIR